MTPALVKALRQISKRAGRADRLSTKGTEPAAFLAGEIQASKQPSASVLEAQKDPHRTAEHTSVLGAPTSIAARQKQPAFEISSALSLPYPRVDSTRLLRDSRPDGVGPD